MRRTFIIWFFLILNAGNTLFSQSSSLSFSCREIPLEDFLDQVKDQFGISFLYRSDLIDGIILRDLAFQHASLDFVLSSVLSAHDLAFELIQKTVVIRPKEAAGNPSPQNPFIVRGIVRDSEGFPLAGAGIALKGSSYGTFTNADGLFMLSVNAPQSVLEISFMGMSKQEVPIAFRNFLDISMKYEAIPIQEVVAIGYGVQRKLDLTGSVSQIKSKPLTRAPIPNLSAALAGKLTGILVTQETGQPGMDDANFQIRGISTMGDNSPLVIVDGIPRPFSRIDPNEIDQITVLKDAASTAVYGARAANGVLLITTKRGQAAPPSFTYSGSYGVQSQTRRIEMMNAAEYAQYLNEAKANFGQEHIFSSEEVAKFQRGERPSYDWLGSVLSNSAPMQRHNLSVTGGDEKMRYFFSFGHLDQKGFYSTANYGQDNFRSNMDIQLTDHLHFGLNLAGRAEDRERSSQPDHVIFQNARFGRPHLNPLLDKEVGPGAIGSNGMAGNPRGFAERSGTNRNLTYLFQSNLAVAYETPFIQGLSVQMTYSFDYSVSSQKITRTPFTIYQLNEATNQYNELKAGPTTISLDERSDRFRNATLQASLHFEKELGVHAINSLLLFEQSESYSNYLSAFRDGFISADIPELFAGGTTIWSNNGGSNETARRGYVGRMGYAFKGKYLFQANMRLDQSFNFPKGKRNGFFPAFSAGWKISEEEFMKPLQAIEHLKLRASWGKVGNDRVPPFQYLTNFLFSGGVVIGNGFQQGILDTGIPNPDITWETATSANIGIDLGLFRNKLFMEFDYFVKRTKDILQPNSGTVPATFGASLPDENIGVVQSWGSEGLIRFAGKLGGLSYTIESNYSWYDNKALFVSEPQNILPSIAQTGRALGLPIGYLTDGLFQTPEEILSAPLHFSHSIHDAIRPGDIKFRDINGRDAYGHFTGKPDGKIDGDDRAIIGSRSTPDLVFGLNLSLEYQGIDLAANFQGATGFSRNIRTITFERDGNTFREFINSWRPGNEDAKYPRLSTGDYPALWAYDSDFWLQEVTYFRLRNLELGFSPKRLKSQWAKMGIRQFRVFLAGTNLITFSNLNWRDPEGNGMENPFYPQVKSISAGVQIQF